MTASEHLNSIALLKKLNIHMQDCPFCGCAMGFLVMRNGYRWYGYHRSMCVLETNPSASYSSLENLVEAWNRRCCHEREEHAREIAALREVLHAPAKVVPDLVDHARRLMKDRARAIGEAQQNPHLVRGNERLFEENQRLRARLLDAENKQRIDEEQCDLMTSQAGEWAVENAKLEATHSRLWALISKCVNEADGNLSAPTQRAIMQEWKKRHE